MGASLADLKSFPLAFAAWLTCIHIAGKSMIIWKACKDSLWMVEEIFSSKIRLLETCNITESQKG